MKIAILYVCTGKYVVFWHDFYLSFEKFFLRDCERHYFVFTDANHLEFEHENKNIHRIYQEAQPWPLPTLFRYKMFLQHEEELKEFDYIYFFNANSEAKQNITREMILPRTEKNEDLVVVQHPGFINLENYDFTYERDPKSKAFIPYGRGYVYVAGGINGGTAKAFLNMCKTINENTEEDYKKGVIALWHDESHLNKYILFYPYYRVINASFAYPDCSWFKSELKPYIYLRDKQKYFEVEELKNNKIKDQTSKLIEQMDRIMKKMAHLEKYRKIMNRKVVKKCVE